MVQRKVPSKLGIQDDHVKSEKRLAKANQDGKSRGADMKKKMKKSRSIKLHDLDALQSSSSSTSPSRRCFSHPGKPPPPPIHVPTMEGSPNYMKPTSSSHAKKELFPVSLKNTPPISNSKNLTRKFSSASKASSVSSKKSAKALTRSSSFCLVRSLTKTTSFKASNRACPRKSARAALCADMSAPQRATCSSTLKDSKFPAYLMLNPGGTELEGISVMKVCPYTYCSLNGHRHDALPPLKSLMSAKRRLLKTQKSMRLDAPSPRRLKAPCDAKKDSEAEQNVFDANPAYDEIDMDIFIEIYAKERETKPIEADQMEKNDFVKRIEECVEQVASEIDLEEDHKKSIDGISVEVDTKGIFLHEEISMRSYCSDESYDGEHMKDAEMDDDSHSKSTEMEWEEQQRLCGFGCKDTDYSSVSSEEDTDSKLESLSESSHDVSVTWLDEILTSYHLDVMAEETFKESNVEESQLFEEQHGIGRVLDGTSGSTEIEEIGNLSNDLGCDQFFSPEVSFEYPGAEVNGKENDKQLDDEPSCDVKVIDAEKIDNNQCQKMSGTCNVGETIEERYSSLENHIESSNEENKGSTMAVQDGKANKFKNTNCVARGKDKDGSTNWKGTNSRKRPVEDEDEMSKFNPREPNFLPLVPEPEPEKVDLRHQMMDERKDAEQWMLDCALRQVVTKLAPARKKKVALLVEAFETIMPIPKCETFMRNNSAFPEARHIQACR